jgi:glycerol-3-phosphate cytidylyltransferase-like family protein
MPWSHKRSIIEACRYVDKTVPAREFSPLKLLKRYQVDVYVSAMNGSTPRPSRSPT